MMVAKEHALLRIKVNLEILASGVILERAPAHGPVVMVWHVMIMTHAHVETRV